MLYLENFLELLDSDVVRQTLSFQENRQFNADCRFFAVDGHLKENHSKNLTEMFKRKLNDVTCR